MSSDYSRAEAITLEQLSDIFGHETAHLERWEQYAIAAKAFMLFADTVQEIAEEMRTSPTLETAVAHPITATGPFRRKCHKCERDHDSSLPPGVGVSFCSHRCAD